VSAADHTGVPHRQRDGCPRRAGRPAGLPVGIGTRERAP
jgi:hypothetical protein